MVQVGINHNKDSKWRARKNNEKTNPYNNFQYGITSEKYISDCLYEISMTKILNNLMSVLLKLITWMYWSNFHFNV